MGILRQSLLICAICIWCLWDQVHSIPSQIKTGSSSFKSSIPAFPLKDSVSKCGQSKNGRGHGLSIVNGKDAMLGAWPWVVGLIEGSPKHPMNIFFCGGTLISEEWVLTAASCVVSKSSTTLYVRLGELDFDDQVKDGATPIDARIEYIKPHPSFPENPPFSNDIALIKLKNPVSFTENIRPICLPNRIEEERSFIITGWGILKPRGEFPSRLQEASVTAVNMKECKKDSVLTERFTINSSVICAGGSGNSSCYRDSGGPLMFFNRTEFYLAGITSGGDRDDCNKRPTVYTNVARYLSWIDEITGEEF